MLALHVKFHVSTFHVSTFLLELRLPEIVNNGKQHSRLILWCLGQGGNNDGKQHDTHYGVSADLRFLVYTDSINPVYFSLLTWYDSEIKPVHDPETPSVSHTTHIQTHVETTSVEVFGSAHVSGMCDLHRFRSLSNDIIIWFFCSLAHRTRPHTALYIKEAQDSRT